MTMPSSLTTNEDLMLAFRSVRATSAQYDPAKDEVVVCLNTGLSLSFKPGDAAGLGRAQACDLMQIEVSPSGLGLHFPALDADLYLPSLLVGIMRPQRIDEWRASVDGLPVSQTEALDRYTYVVRWSAEDHEFVATCTAFPSLSWLDRKPDLALIGVRDLVRSALNDLAADSQQPPAPLN